VLARVRAAPQQAVEDGGRQKARQPDQAHQQQHGAEAGLQVDEGSVGFGGLHLDGDADAALGQPGAGPQPEPKGGPAPPPPPAPSAEEERDDRRTMALLAFAFGAMWFTSSAMAMHLPALLLAMGATLPAALAAAALVGPAQVGARVLEFALMRRIGPLASARAAALGHP
ncbi:MAG: hypothetical protein ACK4RK_22425, partial [Gemmataceae bacterium]